MAEKKDKVVVPLLKRSITTGEILDDNTCLRPPEVYSEEWIKLSVVLECLRGFQDELSTENKCGKLSWQIDDLYEKVIRFFGEVKEK